jgi:lysyl-tRNA synthetase, class II
VARGRARPPIALAVVTAEHDAPAARDVVQISSDGVPEQMRVRREKRERLLAGGREHDPYPVAVPRTHTLAEIRKGWSRLGVGEETDDVVGVAGRVVFVRNSGKLCFATLQEGDGTRLQAMVSLAGVGEAALAAWKRDVDLGDHVYVRGRVISSKRGELSVMAQEWRMAAKALRPLPVLHKEMNEETRVRQRYADLIVRPEARDMVRARAGVVASLRRTFSARGYIEIETPMLQTLHGGATARPFVTHSNAMNTDLYLRIAPELFLKRAVVGGIEKVFEINRNFRNEGADSTHSPEFAMLEFYEAYADYNSMADLTRELVQQAAREVRGSTTVTLADGARYELGGEWPQLSIYSSLSEALGAEVTPSTPLPVLTTMLRAHGLDPDAHHLSHGKAVEELWEHLVGDHLHAPTFVRDFPVETSPLTKAHREIDGVVEKWDLYVRGFELATGYSELNDPVVQRQRFEEQAELASRGDLEAMAVDEDFLRAMEYGMPPAGGVGMGIDRLLMALTGLGIRETILFPLVKPE